MTDFQSWLNTALAAVGPAVILWRLIHVERTTVIAAKGAEDAATLAAAHAAAATEVVAGMAADVKELAVNTNSIQTALNAATATASRLEGREEMRAETEAKAST